MQTLPADMNSIYSAAASRQVDDACATCRHCGLPNDRRDQSPFCCEGCSAVYGLLHAEQLEKYYALRGPVGQPATHATRAGPRENHWLETAETTLKNSAGVHALTLEVQGLHCTACVWLINALFARQVGAERVEINSARGTALLHVQPTFPLRAFVTEVESFGYLLGPLTKNHDRRRSPLLLRMGVAIAIAMNAMTFSVAIFAGLADGPLHDVARSIGWGLAALSVLVGGTYFFQSAYQGLRRGVVHLDTTIALGILFAFGGSTWAFWTQAQAQYFDTVTVFIALMLVGKFLQERVLERNRRQVLQSDGVESLMTRRVAVDGTRLVSCTDLRTGDVLLLASGDLNPVPAKLIGTGADFSLDWINGEATPRRFEMGEEVPAGAFHIGSAPARLIASADFSASPLVELLATPRERDRDGARTTPFWQRYSQLYVMGVLVLGTIGLLGWWLWAGDLQKGLEVATATLVVTCPCAFGIATPLAYELAQAGLRRAGLFIRSAGFLDRALNVTRVVFDKTGTLTQGSLDARLLWQASDWSPEDASVAMTLAKASNHPKSASVARTLMGDRGVQADADLRSTEHPGLGVEWVHGASVARLGKPAWVNELVAPLETEAQANPSVDGDVSYASGGRLRAVWRTQERLRADATREVRQLRAMGYGVEILSGDEPRQVGAIASALQLEPDVARGGLSPTDKAEILQRPEYARTLFIGDGINDSLAVERAFAAGTPAVDRPFMPARTDFYFTTPGLGPVRRALLVARHLDRVTMRNLYFALAYNVLTVGLAFAGQMSPLVAAILMPTSSLSVIAMTVVSLRRGAPVWRL